MDAGSGTTAGAAASGGFAWTVTRERGATGGTGLGPVTDDTQRPAVENLHSLTPARQRRVLLDLLRSGQSDGEIGARFALTQWQVRNLRYRLGIKKDRGGRLRTAEAPAPVAPAANGPSPEPLPSATTIPAASAHRAAPHAETEPPGLGRMGVRLAGTLDAEDAGRRLTAIGGLVAASTGLFAIQVSIHQVQPDAGSAPHAEA